MGATFGGEELFAIEPERLYALLTDLDSVAATIPDAEQIERVDPRTLRCVVRPGFSFLRGTLKLTVVVDEVQPPERAALHVAAQGIGVAMRVDSALAIAAGETGGSRLTWQAEVVEMRGLLAAVSPSLVRAAADQVIRDGWQRIRARAGGATS